MTRTEAIERLDFVSERLAELERTIDVLEQERRELINYLNLNKGGGEQISVVK